MPPTPTATPTILVNLTEDSRRRVFLPDEDQEDPLEALAGFGRIVRFDPKGEASDLHAEDFPRLIAEADAMLTCWGSRPLTTADLAGRPADAPPLFVSHSAGSVRSLVPRDLLEDGRVRLTQGAPAIAVAVAHYTVGLIVLGLRQAVARHDALRAGEKLGGAYFDLEGVPVGLIGLSRVGALVPPLLAPFGARVLAFDPYCSAERAASLGVELVPDLDDLLARSRVVSLHAPVTPETRGILSAARVGALAPGTVLINTARADLLDQEAVFGRALAGEITYYADVTSPEPLPQGHPAYASPHVFITPHIAGPTRQTTRRMAAHAVAEIGRFLRGEPAQAEVTADRYDVLA